MMIFTLIPLVLIGVIIWSIYDLATHWEETDSNVVWLLLLLLVGGIGSVFYFIMVYQPRQNSLK